MRLRTALPTVLAVGGSLAAFVGAKSKLVLTRAAHDWTVQAGAGAELGHEEVFLLQLIALGVVGSVVAVRWRRAALLTQLVGGITLVFVTNAVRFQVVHFDIYTGVPVLGGTSGAVILGPAAYLFAVAGLLLVAAGVLGHQPTPDRKNTPTSLVA